MSLFEKLFHKKKIAESVVLIDICADSVGGAYARYSANETPTILHTRRQPIEPRAGETLESAMLRTLKVLGADLIREGAPVLARATGSGSAGEILVSVDTPWQETTMRTEEFTAEKPFEFTKSLVEKRLKEATSNLSGKLIATESILHTEINGYETRNPYGKRAHRASVTILTSLIERHTSRDILSTLSGLYHTKAIQMVSGSSIRHQTIRAVFPHERESISIDALRRPLISITLVHDGACVSLLQKSAEPGTDTAAWAAVMTDELSNLAKNRPLPRTIFLLAHPADADFLQQTLTAKHFGSLWLSDNPPRIILVLQDQITKLFRSGTADPIELPIILAALYYQAVFQSRFSGPGEDVHTA